MRTGFEVQKAAIFALFLREIRTRFGKYRLGYLWAILQPAGQLLILLAFAHFVFGHQMQGISYTVFFSGGVAPWFLFTNIAIRSINAVQANAGLFTYRPVRPIDAVIARSPLELIVYTASYACLILFARAIGDKLQIDSIAYLIGGFFCSVGFPLEWGSSS